MQDLHRCIATYKNDNDDDHCTYRIFQDLPARDFRSPEDRMYSSYEFKHYRDKPAPGYMDCQIHAPCLDKLINSGFNVNELDRFGTSALTIATMLEKHSFIKKLLDAGANPNLSQNSVSAYEVADEDIELYFVNKGFVPNEKAKALIAYEERFRQDLQDNGQEIANPSGVADAQQIFMNLCKHMGKAFARVHDISGRDNMANLKNSLSDIGLSYKDIIVADLDEIAAMGISPDYCYDIMASQL